MRVIMTAMKTMYGFDNPDECIYLLYNYEDYLDQLALNPAIKYNNVFNYYIFGDTSANITMPKGVQKIPLYWKEIGEDFEHCYFNDVYLYCEHKRSQGLNSNFIGAIGERINLDVTVTKIIPIRSIHKTYNLYIMKDSDANLLSWKTTSIKLEVNHSYHLAATIKDHVLYNNSNQTVLTRCKILD